MWEAPTVPIETKICLAGNLADIITCAKFQEDIFRGYNFTGVEFPIFLLIFAWALQQCRAMRCLWCVITISSHWSASPVRKWDMRTVKAASASEIVTAGQFGHAGQFRPSRVTWHWYPLTRRAMKVALTSAGQCGHDAVRVDWPSLSAHKPGYLTLV